MEHTERYESIWKWANAAQCCVGPDDEDLGNQLANIMLLANEGYEEATTMSVADAILKQTTLEV